MSQREAVLAGVVDLGARTELDEHGRMIGIDAPSAEAADRIAALLDRLEDEGLVRYETAW